MQTRLAATRRGAFEELGVREDEKEKKRKREDPHPSPLPGGEGVRKSITAISGIGMQADNKEVYCDPDKQHYSAAGDRKKSCPQAFVLYLYTHMD